MNPISPKAQLYITLGVCALVLGLLVMLLVRVDHSTDLRNCSAVANEEIRHIPARCLNYYLNYEDPDSTPTS